MKRSILSVVMVLLVCTGAYAESSVWKVQKGKSVAYLGATFHLLRRTDYPLPPEFDKAYKASDIVVFETDIGKLYEPSTQEALMAQALYDDGSTIEKHLSVEAYGKLSAYCTANNIPLEAFRQLKPSVLMLTLTTMELMKLGVTQQGVDTFYYRRARDDGKTVEGLETVEEQIHYLVSMSDGNEDDFVTYSLDDMQTARQQFEILVNAWRRGDAEKVNAVMAAELAARMPKLYKRLITERNAKWLPLIDAYLKTPQTEFILVGAGHLAGPEGIIAALGKKGYKVEKL